jgi:hypothetical protein
MQRLHRTRHVAGVHVQSTQSISITMREYRQYH